jgi:hypothetical protein
LAGDKRKIHWMQRDLKSHLSDECESGHNPNLMNLVQKGHKGLFTVDFINKTLISQLSVVDHITKHWRKVKHILSASHVYVMPIISTSVYGHKKKTTWPESASELYRPSDRRLSAKLVSTFGVRGMSRSQRGVSPTAVISLSTTEPLLFLSSSSSIVLTRLRWLRSRETASQEIW